MLKRLRNLYKISKWIHKNDLADDFLRVIERPDARNKLVTGVCGWAWEDEVKEICQQRDFVYLKAHEHLPFDCTINLYKVQCKYTASHKNTIDIRSKNKNTDRRYYKEDFDFLLLKAYRHGERYPRYYVIPIAEMLDKKVLNGNFTKKSIDLDDYGTYYKHWNQLSI